MVLTTNKLLIKIINHTLNVVNGIFILITVWLFSTVFLYATFSIPTDSMEPALQPGDAVFVWKPIIGARLFNVNATLRNEQVEIYRTPGFRKIKRNDVLVFNFPHPNNWSKIEMHVMKYYIKRCIGLPGDTLSIQNGEYRINGVDEPLGCLSAQKQIGDTPKEMFQKEIFKSFPYDSLLNWNIQDFGPLYIPLSGSEIQMNRTNYVLYKKLIEWEQGGKTEFQDSLVTLNGKIISTYRFRKSYYFMGGDNGMNSQDSRYWGLLPEEYIVGKAAFIWKSRNPYTDEFRWDRFLKRVE